MGNTIRSPFGGAELQTPVYGATIAVTITNSETVITPGTLTGPATINLTIDSEVQGGAEIALILTDDGAGRVVTFGTGFHTGTPAHTMGAGLTTALVFQHDGTDFIQVDSAGTAINIAAAQAATAALLAGTTARTGRIKNTTAGSVITPEAGVTAVDYGDGTHITTVLTLAAKNIGAIAAAANEAIGVKIAAFPAGVHIHKVARMSIGLTGDAGVAADTPDLGLGSVVAVGAVAVLGGTATFEDYITGQTVTNCTGTAKVAMTVPTAGVLTGIALNATGDVKDLYLNVADGWAAASATLTATGTIVISWEKIA